MVDVTVDIFISADGYAGSDGLPPYFGCLGPELEEWIAVEAAVPQLALMGRRTYEAFASLPEEYRDESYTALSELEKIVFSRSLKRVDWPSSRISTDLESEVRGLKGRDDDISVRTIGSMSLARQLVDAGLVDRLRLMTFPLLAGPHGREPFFTGLAAGALELVGHRVLDGRVLLVEYRPTGDDIPRVG